MAVAISGGMRSADLRLLVLCAAAAGCSPKQPPAAATEHVPAAVPLFAAPSAAAPSAAAPSPGAGDSENRRVGFSGNHREEENEWMPAEFKVGAARWKDTGVYLDGRPIGFLTFGDLPIELEPVWVDEEISIPVKPGSKGPDHGIIQQRYYRFTDYLRAAGVDLRRVRELHVYGPKFSETIVVTGAELRGPKGRDFLFRFGGDVCGKAIPRVPARFGNGKSPDKISAVVVYVDKKPPRLVWNKGLELDGELQTGIPYFGEPLRGGVRVYLDDRLATVIKRRLLKGSLAEERDGVPHWNLFRFLEAQGVDTSRIVEAWIIHRDQRVERLDRAALETATFQASPQRSGEILVGERQVRANALAFHTRPVPPEKLPQLRPYEHFATVSEN